MPPKYKIVNFTALPIGAKFRYKGFWWYKNTYSEGWRKIKNSYMEYLPFNEFKIVGTFNI